MLSLLNLKTSSEHFPVSKSYDKTTGLCPSKEVSAPNDAAGIRSWNVRSLPHVGNLISGRKRHCETQALWPLPTAISVKST